MANNGISTQSRLQRRSGHYLKSDQCGFGRRLLVFLLLVLSLFQISCTKKAELGSKKNPIKFYLVPGQEIQVLKDTSKALKAYLEKETGLVFDVQVPVSYIALVEAFGTKRADVGIVNTFGYILAHEKYGVTARLRIISYGRNHYFGQILAHKDGIKNIKDIDGKKFAFVDPASSSGYLLAAQLFKERNLKPKEFVFAGRHDSVVSMVYQKQVDAGATFHVPEKNDKGQPMDARRLVRAQYPDVDEKVVILEKTGPIPNDPVIFRKDIPIELQNKIVELLRKFVKSEEGLKTFKALFNVTDFEIANDSDYDKVRSILKDLGREAQDFL